jgi:hypothetical protein
MKYPSLTTPDVEHDAANLLTEFIWLNKNIRSESYPWRGDHAQEWGKMVAAIKKLMTDSYGLSKGQLAFYIWQCKPRFIDPRQFAKMVAVARRLFKSYDLEQASRLYQDWQKELASSGLEKAKYKENKPKTLLSFLRELESGKTS